LKEINQALLLGRSIGREALAPVTASFADRVMAFERAPGRTEADRGRSRGGRRLVLATASYRLYVEDIAKRLGFDAVIATGTMTGLDDRIRAKVDGENCYGPAKLRMIEAWMAQQRIGRSQAHIRFYSDHVSDACVLEWADEPVAVNASRKLRRLAEARGWRQEDWGL
jgi:phosphoserine phosphatase